MVTLVEAKNKLIEVGKKVENDLHLAGLVKKLEAVVERVHQAPVEDVVKTAVASDIHDAATKVEAVADTMRSDVDAVDKVVDTADKAVDTAAK